MACCPSIWWCTPDGPEEVTPDASGIYTRPPDATGHPYRSIGDAVSACLVCSGARYTIPRFAPGGITATAASPTGCFNALSVSNKAVGSVICLPSWGAVGLDESLMTLLEMGADCAAFSTFRLNVLYSQQLFGGSGGGFLETVTVSGHSSPISPAVGHLWFVPNTGWSLNFGGTGGTSFAVSKTTASGFNSTITSPMLIGTVSLRDLGNTTTYGSAELYIQ